MMKPIVNNILFILVSICGLKKSMCVAAKGRLQGRAATLLLLCVGFFLVFLFVFMQQKFLYHSVVCLFTMNANGCVYETFGISKHFPIKLQLLLIRAKTLDNPLTAKCFIHDVVF
jgi:hypothetical membrane protein